MCKYCERFNGDANNYLDRQKIDLLEGRGINQEMFLMEDQNNPGNFYLQICNNLTNEVISSVKLNYCPFCRRKLNKAFEDMASEELVESAWNSVPSIDYENTDEPAWKSVPAYTGFTGSTLAARWDAEYAAQSEPQGEQESQSGSVPAKLPESLPENSASRNRCRKSPHIPPIL